MPGQLRQFLESEYEEAKVSPAYLRLQNKTYLIPYPYVRDYDDFQKAFMNDFFDVMRHDYHQYKKNNIEPRWVHWRDNEESWRLVVPYDLRNKEIDENDVARRIFERADKKYRRAVRLSASLAKAYPERPFQTMINIAQVKKMQKAYYEYNLKQARDHAAYITQKVGNFLSRNAVKATQNLTSLTVDKLKLSARKWALRTMLAATVATAVYTAVNHADISDKINQGQEQKAHDPYGNLKMFESCRNDIKVSLAFVENFAPKAFKDGLGYPTIGYGCTYYLDENGKGNREISPVKMGQTTTLKEALEQKDRYLNFRILPQIERLVKVPLDKATMIATVNFAYVIGPKAFQKSKYLEALNQGKKNEELTKFLTGFRQQPGLLPRFYFMAQMVNGRISAADLLNLKAEGCYNLTVKDVCKVQDGKIITDKDHMACFHKEGLAENLKKAAQRRRSVVNGNQECPLVRDILPADLVKSVEKNNVKNFCELKEIGCHR